MSVVLQVRQEPTHRKVLESDRQSVKTITLAYLVPPSVTKKKYEVANVIKYFSNLPRHLL